MWINSERLQNLVLALADITEQDKPYTRRSFSPMFLQGRKWLEQQMQQAGMTTHIDSAGNLVATLKGDGTKSGVIAIGSHSDTVPCGGRFDGAAGVLAGLECVLTWRDLGIVLQHDVQIIDFLAEETSEWNSACCIGSRGITNSLSDEILTIKHPQTGELLAEAVDRIGGDCKNLQARDDIKSFFELHIEQGGVLEKNDISIGVVTSIVGIKGLTIEITGQSNHAGTTPMGYRQDTLVCAAYIITQLTELAAKLTQVGRGYLVATCGQIMVDPDARNVIKGYTKLLFDVRFDNEELFNEFALKAREIVENCVEKTTTRITNWRLTNDMNPIATTVELQNYIIQAASDLKKSYLKLPSGAGHDSAYLAKIAPTAMIFVPSHEGKSHCSEEWTDFDKLADGVSVLSRAVLLCDKSIN